MSKIFDCITFFNENFITNFRFEVLHKFVDYFVVCESKFDHRGKKKKLNFFLKNKKIKNKIIYLVLDKPFLSDENLWLNQAQQREHIFEGLNEADENDLIMFSDPDEIPRPELLKNFSLKKTYGIFLQNCFCYKFNILNQYETPWEGTRICQLKNLKSIDYMRQKIKKKNLQKPFWKMHINKNIQLIKDGGWHFNSLLSPLQISIKLKTFAHSEYAAEKFSNINIIKNNIKKMRDLFGRNQLYKKVRLDNTFPKYLLDNKLSFKKWIL